MPGWEWTHLPFGENRDHKLNPKTGKYWSPTGVRLKRMGTKRGWPDYIFIGPGQQAFFLEMKRGSRGRIADEQDRIAAHLKCCGFDYFCAHSFEEAVMALEDRRIIRARVR